MPCENLFPCNRPRIGRRRVTYQSCPGTMSRCPSVGRKRNRRIIDQRAVEKLLCLVVGVRVAVKSPPDSRCIQIRRSGPFAGTQRQVAVKQHLLIPHFGHDRRIGGIASPDAEETAVDTESIPCVSSQKPSMCVNSWRCQSPAAA
jgi:hypothetical protein